MMEKDIAEEKKALVILTGPTAAGKTALSIDLAKRIGGEIISADSMQVYRYMDIGSAKITPEEMQGVPHYLVDVLDPREEFHVLRFQQMAKEALEQIRANGHIPIVVGGTGFYIQALLYDVDFTQEADLAYRQHLEEIIEKEGPHRLHQMLREADPASAEAIHENNHKRLIRALEFYHTTGTRLSEHNQSQRAKESPYRFAYFVLTDERERLYQNIDLRVDRMMEAGLVDEVRRLKEMGCQREMVSMQGLGYKEILDYLDRKISLEEAVYRIKRDTRHFAKRQLTWFRRERDVIWLDQRAYGYSREALLDKILQDLRDGGIWNS